MKTRATSVGIYGEDLSGNHSTAWETPVASTWCNLTHLTPCEPNRGAPFWPKNTGKGTQQSGKRSKDPTYTKIIEVCSSKFKIPINIKWYDGTTDLEDHLSRFSSAANSGEWPMPVPKTVDEMMVRLDDFVRSEEAFTKMELPKGEVSEVSKKLVGPDSRREDRLLKGGYGADRRRNDEMSAFNIRDGLAPYRP
ncbi:hypothetical protein Tco_1503794 [Tanacetum coccineum]